ncbi:MAG: RNA polymerase sigma factor [Bacteroidota bacterium]
MRQYSDRELLHGIYSHNTRVLNTIYREYLPYIDHYVRQHGGTSEEAKDVFQEGMIIIYFKINSGGLNLKCKFSTYLYAVCKNIWIQASKKRKRQAEMAREKYMVVEEPSTEIDPASEIELKNLFERQFIRLSQDCQLILRMFFSGSSLQEIRDALGYKTIQHTVDRKYRCNKSLVNKIMQDPVFNELKDGLY